MRFTIFIASLIIGLVASAPTSDSSEDEKVIVTKEFFPDSLVAYTAEHDIVNLFVPLNSLNFDDDEDDETDTDDNAVLFFIQADKNEQGELAYKGLYTLKNGVATKLLENGQDFAAANDDTKFVYFGAQDGLYIYNEQTNTADKYGPITDNIISIAKENGTDVLYILTKDHTLYEVTENGTKKEKMNIRDAQQIMLDYSNNVYYFDSEKKPCVLTSTGIVEIQGLPENPKDVQLLRPAFVIEDGVPFVSDNKIYIIYANGTSEFSDFELQAKPTAYSMEATLIQYYAYEKKIYEYNILFLLLNEVMSELKTFLEDKKDSIESIATRSRSGLSP